MSTILKIFAFPLAVLMMSLGIMTILGGHITPGGGFQGGAMIAAGVILCLTVYSLKGSPIRFSHQFMTNIESFGALGYVTLGLCGLIFSGCFLYNLGSNLNGLVSTSIQNIFNYPDPANAGIVPYLNIFVGLKVAVGLTGIVMAFMEFDPDEEENGEHE